MRRLFAVVVVTVLAVTIAAATASARPGGAPPTKKPGTLVIGFDLPAPNFIQGTAVGTSIRNPTGFEVDLANAIGKRLGLKVEWLRAPFGSLFRPGPKPFDFAFEQITITTARKRVVDFSGPYFDANQGVLIAEGVRRPRSLADLRQLQTCGQAATTGLDYINTQLRPTRRPLVYEDLAAAFQAVRNGTCEAIVMDVPISLSERNRNPLNYGPLAGQIVTKEQYGALFQKGSPLRAHINGALKALKADGTIGRLQKKWFNVNFAKIPILR